MKRSAIPGVVGFAALSSIAAAQVGEWEQPITFGVSASEAVRAVHMLHVVQMIDGVPTGKILALPDDSRWQENCSGATGERSDLARLWTPPAAGASGNGVFSNVPLSRSYLFCSGHSSTADGRILVLGGAHELNGIFEVNLFDPNAASGPQWNPSQTPDNFTYARWYPTSTTLPDGNPGDLGAE